MIDRMSKLPDIRMRRAYDGAGPADGCRVLVDRLWPRGVSKDDLQIAHWMRDLAPSTGLRKNYCHDPEKWEDFRARYFDELREHPENVNPLLALCAREPVTLVFAAKDAEHSNARALKEFLEEELAKDRAKKKDRAKS